MKKKSAVCLVVDDDPISLSILRQIVEEVAMTVHSATDGEEAAALLTQNKYDCIISDIEMPRMSGLELLTLAHKLSPATPFVIVSKFDNTENLRAAWTRGCFDFIQKPFDRSYVHEVINLALEFGQDFLGQTAHNPIQIIRKIKNKEELLWDHEQFCGVLSDDAGLIADVIVSAKSSLLAGAEELMIAVQANETKVAARLLHRMKGTLENLYAPAIVTLTQQIELTLKNGQMLTHADVDYFQRQIVKLTEQFDSYLSGMKKNG
jgi:CheY-like chemotaxis protein